MDEISIYFEKLILEKKLVFRWILSLCMTVAGISHFLILEQYINIVPEVLPYPAAIVYLSGVIEIVGGIGLLIPQVSFLAAWCLVILLIAIYLASINMALNNLQVKNIPDSWWFQAIGLQLQFILIIWAWWLSKPDPK